MLEVILWFFLAAVSSSCIDAAAQQSDEGYRKVTGPCHMRFPEDHGAHPGYRTEWWYYTGNLQTARQRSFGFQMTIFRRSIRAPGSRQASPDKASRWRTRQIFFGHAAVTDIDGERHIFSESIARGAMGLSGVRQSEDRTSVFLNKWAIDIQADIHRLQAVAADFSFDLDLQPVKPPVLHGEQGYSRKGDSRERASCYYSFTRLQTTGSIRIGEETFELTGHSWMDHEFSTASLQPGIVGWDWFSLQLNDGTDLMVYLLRQADGSFHPASSGTLVGAGGRSMHLEASDVKMSVVETWESPLSNASYPTAWTLGIDRHAIDLTIRARLADQEMQTGTTAGITYWEGSVAASGSAKGLPVQAAGYVELTGYAHEMEVLR